MTDLGFYHKTGTKGVSMETIETPLNPPLTLIIDAVQELLEAGQLKLPHFCATNDL